MALYTIDGSSIREIEGTDFHQLSVKERDIQRLLRSHVQAIAPDCMVLAEEFGDWDEGRRRIDLLCLDTDANLVVVELKRTEDGGHMELQALRYAAMVSTMTFDQAVAAHAQHLAKEAADGDARDAILEFLGWDEPNDDEFAQDVHIVLASAEFSKEITTAVLWLSERGLDIRCVRMAPYQLDERILLDVQQIVPLPEAADYQVRVREKERRERADRKTSRDYTKFDVEIDGVTHERQAKRNAIFLVAQALCERGVEPDEIAEVIPWKGRVWRALDGELGEDDFIKAALAEAKAGGKAFNEKRWFCEEHALVHSGGKTHAFTKMWGGDTEKALETLLELFSSRASGVKVTVASD